MTIPNATANPVEIVISTSNVPDGAIVKLRLTLEDGSTVEVDSTAVSSNSATASVDLAVGSGVLYATASLN